MTVGDLLVALREFPLYTPVIIAKDSEGNRYSPLSGYDGNTVYVPSSRWDGEIRLAKLTPELRDMGWTEEDVFYFAEEDGENEMKGVRCVVLWPTV